MAIDVSERQPQLRRDAARGAVLGLRHRDGVVVLRDRGGVGADPSVVAPDEAGMLGAFDSHRDRICAAAARLYARGRKGSYELGAGDV